MKRNIPHEELDISHAEVSFGNAERFVDTTRGLGIFCGETEEWARVKFLCRERKGFAIKPKIR